MRATARRRLSRWPCARPLIADRRPNRLVERELELRGDAGSAGVAPEPIDEDARCAVDPECNALEVDPWISRAARRCVVAIGAPAVELIADERKAEIREHDPDLVEAPGVEPDEGVAVARV